MDPIFAEQEAAVHRAQSQHLRCLEDSIENRDFDEFLTAHHACAHAGSQGPTSFGGGAKFDIDAPQAAARTRRQERYFRSLVEKVKREAALRGERRRAVMEAKAKATASSKGKPVLDSWDVQSDDSALSDDEVKYGSYGADLGTWASLRQGQATEFAGRGYGASFSQYAEARERVDFGSAYMSRNHVKPLTHRERRSLRREFRQEQQDEESYLVFEAFKPNAESKSLVMSKAHYSAVDSGTQLTIVRKGGRKFVGFDPKAAVKIMGFNGSVTMSAGRGDIVGFAKTRQGQVISLRVPNAHVVPSAPSDLLSVSALVVAGYSFHFTPNGSWIVTPEMEILDLVEKSGLYWLKWHEAVDSAPQRTTYIDHAESVGEAEDKDLLANAAGTYDVEDEEEDLPVIPEDEGRLELNCVESPDMAPFDFSQCRHRGCASCNLVTQARGQAVPLALLHQRLGHFHEDTIIKMVDNRSVDVTLSDRKICVCEACKANKLTRSSVPKEREQETTVSKPFERVWTDIKGKTVRDFWGNQYIITFTCEVTRFTAVYFCQRKSQAKDRVK